MSKPLPARPNLDHLRRQAKVLLARLEANDPAAASTFIAHLPAASGLSSEQVRLGRFRLADAQAAIARQSGFAGWPHLARHVEQLRALEGSWSFTRLEIDGSVMPEGTLTTSRILIDGDRFRTDSPDATYEGIFNINVELDPHEIDLEFIAGPEAGNVNFGIFRLVDDQLEICLDLNGKPRPKRFGTEPGSGRAFETLHRASPVRPEGVTGGVSVATAAPSVGTLGKADDFPFIDSPTLAKLQGQWLPQSIIRDGETLPATFVATGLRTMTKNETSIVVGGQTVIHAHVRLDETTLPVGVDYFHLEGPAKGVVQHGVFEWRGELACFCMAAPGEARPQDFMCIRGSKRTYTEWRAK